MWPIKKIVWLGPPFRVWSEWMNEWHRLPPYLHLAEAVTQKTRCCKYLPSDTWKRPSLLHEPKFYILIVTISVWPSRFLKFFLDLQLANTCEKRLASHNKSVHSCFDGSRNRESSYLMWLNWMFVGSKIVIGLISQYWRKTKRMKLLKLITSFLPGDLSERWI